MRTINVIEGIFFAALEKQTPTERNAYLDEACRGDPELRVCVDRMLQAQPKIGEFLQPPAAPHPPRVDHAPPDEKPGTILGPYKLLHEIGEGGMGTVWMAEQSEPVKRRVALKVIKPGMDSKQVLARFEAERQALALMDHPNIAKVLDAGATDNGRPYFVMELVKGQPITEFCDKNRLSTRERLELFVCVCHAIQHAHQKGVIHRDIKPSNVLVALYDGKPVPKVIDFGIAKATVEPLTTKTLFTRHGQVVGTFEYMSPEQATLDQVDVDTRSDVYSLGVLLYELLTGTTPLDKERFKQGGLGEILRLIREEEPPKPSTRLTTTPGLLATAAAYRQSDSHKLRKIVRGELDWIVMKALDKDRNRRFSTANSLADDVERYLKDEPVEACPPTLGYRLRKYARKHKVAFTMTSAVAAALVVGIALTSWQAVQATNAKRETAAEQDRTQAALDDALRIGKERDAHVIELQDANKTIHRAREEMRHASYAGDMQALPLTWEAGNAAEARMMLKRQDADLRNFEWHYWNQQLHTEHTTGTLPGVPEVQPGLRGGGFGRAGRPAGVPQGSFGTGDWRFSRDGSRIAYLTRSEGSSKPHEHTLRVWDAATRKLLLPHPIAVEGFPAGADLGSWADFSLSDDGKRVAVAVSCYPGVERKGSGGPSPLYPASEKDRYVIHVIDVDSKKVIFNSGKKEDGEWSTPSVRLSRDGRRLLSDTARLGGAADARRVTVWDLDSTDKEPAIIDNATQCLFSPNGSFVHGHAITEDGMVPKAWDSATGKELPDFARSGVFSPKGTYLASVLLEGEGPNKTPTLKLYDGTTGKELRSTPLTGALVDRAPRANFGRFWMQTFSPDESLVAVPHRSTAGTPRTNWHIVDTQTGRIQRTLEDRAPTRMTGFGLPGLGGGGFFSGEGPEAQFVCVNDNAIYTFDVARDSARPVRTLRGHVNSIVAAVMAPDNQLLRTIEGNGTLKEWNLEPPKLPAPIAVVERGGPDGLAPSSRFGYSVNAGGGYAAIVERALGDKPYTVRVWDLAGNRSASFEAKPFKAARSPVGGQGLFISADGKRVALGRSDPRLGGTGGVGPVVPKNPPAPTDVTVWEWDPATGTKKEVFHHELPPADANHGVGGVAGFSQDGTTVVLYRRDRVGTLPDGGNRIRTTTWTVNVDTKREGPSITYDGIGLAGGNRLSPDGTRLAGIVRTPAADGLQNEQVVVWDLVRGTQVWAISATRTFPELPSDSGPSVVFWSPDGSRLAVLNGLDYFGSVALLDAATGKLIRTLTPSTRTSIAPANLRFAFSPDGRRIACEIFQRSGVSAISVLDTESGKEVLSLTLPFGFRDRFEWGGEVNGTRLTFSPDGHRLLLFTQVSRAVIDGKWVSAAALRVHTWDATPRTVEAAAPK